MRDNIWPRQWHWRALHLHLCKEPFSIFSLSVFPKLVCADAMVMCSLWKGQREFFKEIEGSGLLHCLLHRILPWVLSKNSGHSNDWNTTSAIMCKTGSWRQTKARDWTAALSRESPQTGQQGRMRLTAEQCCRLSESQRPPLLVFAGLIKKKKNTN